MATIANWNGHTFEVSPSLIRGFTDLHIEGGCETTTKNSSKQKYEVRKYGESPTISMKVSLNAQTGVTDVYSEAMEFIQEANEGANAYFYLGTAKLVAAKLILTKASISEIVTMPMSGERWISCDVQLTFKQGTKNDSNGSSSSSGGSSSKKASVKTTGTMKKGNALEVVAGTALGFVTGVATSGALNKVKTLIDGAKAGSKSAGLAGLSYKAAQVEKATQKSGSSAKKISATTGRATGGSLSKKLNTSSVKSRAKKK